MEAIAPDTTRTRPLMFLLAGVGAFGGLMTVVVLTQGLRTALDWRALGGAATMLVAGGLGALWLLLWHRNSRLLVGPGGFGFQDIIGRRHTWVASEVANVLDVTIRYSNQSIQETVFIIGLDGRRIMALNARAWRSSSIERLVSATGHTLEARPEPVSAADFRREFPRAIGWASTHPGLMGAGLAVVLIALAVGIPIASIWIHR